MSGRPRVLNTFPPNYKQINEAFDVRGKRVLFAYGDTIHNPSRIIIPPQLIVHEAVHLQRQAQIIGGAETWWRRYIANSKFRLAEEIPAHVAEYASVSDQPDGEMQLFRIATRLASPLYGSLIDADEARQIIRDGAEQPITATVTSGNETKGTAG